MNYSDFLKSKTVTVPSAGIEPERINPLLFDFQQDIVRWALRRGRAALWEDCGLGKTPQQLEWAKQISKLGKVLIVCPLCVIEQTIEQGTKFGVLVKACRSQADVTEQISITNYEVLEHFDPSQFIGIVVDESSILKQYDGATRNAIINFARNIPYRLACTATPAPNDYMEIGNHAEFLGVMSRVEMLSKFFVHDGGDTSKWRLKGHAEAEFWNWVCSWAVVLRAPSDLGYDDGDFILPPLYINPVTVASKPLDGYLFPMEASGLQERIAARRESVDERVAAAAALFDGSKWLFWCKLNSEQDKLAALLGDKCVSIQGSTPHEKRVEMERAWRLGDVPVLITKPKCFGYGMNWQHCANVALVGLSDSWEEYYQAIRRCWRFGQTKVVNVYVIASEAEGSVVANIQRKERDAADMAEKMVNHMHELNKENIKGSVQTKDTYKTACAAGDGWKMHMGDCVDIVRSLDSGSVGYSIFSPPFASLYTYSASDRDMGNSSDYAQFFEHFDFLIAELFRVLMPGRLVSFHCMDLPTTLSHHGYIGLQDFRGDLIRAFQKQGFILHSHVTIWKDPVTAMQRTKALGLLWKQVKKDSCMSRQGVPDYLVTMRKPGKNAESDLVSHTAESFPVDQWQQWASPVWMDINPSDTLQYRSAREHKDERHICPLQLEVIRRGLVLWSNPGDIVLSPFAGIGSEGYMALGGRTMSGAAVESPRQFIGCELKESYYKQAVGNLQAAVTESKSQLLIA